MLQTLAAGMWAVAVVWEVIRLGGGPDSLSGMVKASPLRIGAPAGTAGWV